MNKFAIITGEPKSINSEIIIKFWKKANYIKKKNTFLIGDADLFKRDALKLKYRIRIKKIKDLDEIVSNKICIMEVKLKNFSKFKTKAYLFKCFQIAHDLSIRKKIKGFINCPVDKNIFNGTKYKGVTEYLAEKCKIKKNSEVMVLNHEKTSVVPITTHIRLKNVASSLNKNLISEKLKTLNSFFKKYLNRNPKIAVLGLNPHNNEMKPGSEEKKIIVPIIKKFKKKGFIISGPFASDTLFAANFKNFDIILGMYHDQVLIPFKTLFKFKGINFTLGLNYMRLSPDHGPAKNIIGKKIADPSSLIKCVKFLTSL